MGPHAHSQPDKRITCVIAHDHVLLRQGIRRLLEDESDIEVVGEAGNADEGLREVREHQPEVVIADPGLFGGDPEACVRCILQKSQKSKVLFLTADQVEGPAAKYHAAAHAVRYTSGRQLIEWVRGMGRSGQSHEDRHRRNVAEWPEVSPRERSLTIRERQVLKLLAEGRTVRSVASVLGLSVKTVDAHKFNLMRKLGIHNKAELVLWAIQKRVLKLPVNL